MTTDLARRARLMIVTAASEVQAAAIARALLDERLAACVNIAGPVRSVYRWAGEIHDEPEYLMLIKTRAALAARVERRVRELHSYEVPEILAFAPVAGSEPYLRWLIDSTVAPSPANKER